MKGKTVDTLLVGCFKKTDQDLLQYWPHPDYLQVGKFKLQKGTLKGLRLVGADFDDAQRG